MAARAEVPVELVLDARASTGECPTWSDREQALYWVDIEEPALHRFHPRTGEDRAWTMPSQIASFALCRSGRILVALRTGLATLDLEGGTHRFLAPPPYDMRTHRFNDGKCDRQGRFWISIMRKPMPGTEAEDGGPPQPLHMFDASGLRPAPAQATTGNGLAWSPDSRTLYFTDTKAALIQCFDFDPGSGAIGNPRVFAQFAPEQGKPDGGTVDAEGGYWCSLYGGSRLVRINPDGTIEREILLPVSQPTMCAFGGAELDTLYITSASAGLGADVRSREPAGALLRCRPGLRGLPSSLFAD